MALAVPGSGTPATGAAPDDDDFFALPDDEAIGIACGWWPCFANETGAYVKLNGDGTGTIVTGAQENGTGSVMAFPLYAAEVLGMDASQLSITYQDTDAAPWDAGSSGSQTTFNGGRAVIEAAQDIREQLLDALDGVPLAVQRLVDAPHQRHVLGAVIAAIAGAGQRAELGEARLPVTQHVLRHAEFGRQFADRAERVVVLGRAPGRADRDDVAHAAFRPVKRG